MRLADRYALMLAAGDDRGRRGAWLISGDPLRGARRTGRGDAVSADPRRPGRLHRRRLASGAARHPDQGRRAAGGAGAHAHRAVRQDRNADGRRRAAAFRRGGAGRERRRGADGSAPRSSRRRIMSSPTPSWLRRWRGACGWRCPSRCGKPWARARRRDRRPRGQRRFARADLAGGRRPSEWATRAIRRASWRSALVVFVAVEGRPIGAIAARRRAASRHAAGDPAAARAGVARIVMVTGDRADAAETIGAALDLDAVLADRVPSDKVDAVRSEQRASSDHHGRRRHQRRAGAGGRRCRHRHGRPRRQRLVGSRRRGDPRRPARSGRARRS